MEHGAGNSLWTETNVSKSAFANAVPFEEFCNGVQACSLKEIDMGALYEEFGIVESVISSPEMKNCQTSEERYLKLQVSTILQFRQWPPYAYLKIRLQQ
ncbi:UNVERIFIED_CONTAM: hypothetical protein FKN15_038881 [Acipenser sinensis]